MDFETLILAMNFAKSLVAQMATGIKKFEVEGEKLVIYTNDDEKIEMSFSPFEDGLTLDDFTIENNELKITLSNGIVYNAGEIPTSPGKIYEHTQDTAARVWTVQHNLTNQYPVVIAFDEDGYQIIGDIDYKTTNLLEIDFGVPLAGRAIIKNGG